MEPYTMTDNENQICFLTSDGPKYVNPSDVQLVCDSFAGTPLSPTEASKPIRCNRIWAYGWCRFPFRSRGQSWDSDWQTDDLWSS